MEVDRPRRGRQGAARACRRSGSRWPAHRASRPSRSGPGSRPPPTRFAPSATCTSPGWPRRRPPTAPARRRSAPRPRRSPCPATGSGRPTPSRRCRPSGRPSAPAPRAEEKTLWERFHAACDGFFTRRREDLQQPQGGVGREPGAQGSALRPGRGDRRDDRVAEGDRRHQAAAGRVEDRRPGAKDARRRAVAALPGRLRQVLRRLPAARPGRGRGRHRRGRGRMRRARGAAAGGRRRIARWRREGLADTVADIRRRWAAKIAALPRERAIRMGDRFVHALARVTETWPASFAGTDIDPEANARMLEDLCAAGRATARARIRGQRAAGVRPRTRRRRRCSRASFARRWPPTPSRAAADESAKWKTIAEQVRAAQAAWKRVGPVPDSASRTLNARFQRACTRVAEKMDRARRGL